MSNSTIATNIHQSLNVHLDLRTEITFNFELSADNFTDLSCLVIRPLANLQVTVYTGLIQYLC